MCFWLQLGIIIPHFLRHRVLNTTPNRSKIHTCPEIFFLSILKPQRIGLGCHLGTSEGHFGCPWPVLATSFRHMVCNISEIGCTLVMKTCTGVGLGVGGRVTPFPTAIQFCRAKPYGWHGADLLCNLDKTSMNPDP